MKAPLGGTIESRRHYNACYPAGHETYNYNYTPFPLGIETGQFGPLALGGGRVLDDWMDEIESISHPSDFLLSFSFLDPSLPRVYETKAKAQHPVTQLKPSNSYQETGYN
jgi:hypothetical protein